MSSLVDQVIWTVEPVIWWVFKVTAVGVGCDLIADKLRGKGIDARFKVADR